MSNSSKLPGISRLLELTQSTEGRRKSQRERELNERRERVAAQLEEAAEAGYEICTIDAIDGMELQTELESLGYHVAPANGSALYYSVSWHPFVRKSVQTEDT